jgi:hypothetical protein
MTYAQYGLIQASDFNNLVGGSAANVSGQLNCVLGVGNRDVGYGQTTIGNVAQYDKIYATDWASMINKLNTVRQHQTGSGTGILAPTTGNLIQYISTLSSSITSAYSSRLSYASSGSTTTGSNFTDSITDPGGSTASAIIHRFITFGSSDQARYFFNAGGKITVVTSATANNSTNRSASIVTLLNTNFVSDSMYAISYSGRSGTGGSVTEITTGSTCGYYGAPSGASYTTVCAVHPSGYYTNDSLTLGVRNSGAAGSNGGNGNVVDLRFIIVSQADADALDVTVTTRVDITPPETTYLSNSWGTITIT